MIRTRSRRSCRPRYSRRLLIGSAACRSQISIAASFSGASSIVSLIATEAGSRRTAHRARRRRRARRRGGGRLGPGRPWRRASRRPSAVRRRGSLRALGVRLHEVGDDPVDEPGGHNRHDGALAQPLEPALAQLAMRSPWSRALHVVASDHLAEHVLVGVSEAVDGVGDPSRQQFDQRTVADHGHVRVNGPLDPLARDGVVDDEAVGVAKASSSSRVMTSPRRSRCSSSITPLDLGVEQLLGELTCIGTDGRER